mmetsp:Transcript_11254/g.22296  ORF Transcript_11254/g.22296 Transcript_11254/m.22296 type:complete len:209 (+) Transcript_11254:666-1292(+)
MPHRTLGRVRGAEGRRDDLVLEVLIARPPLLHLELHVWVPHRQGLEDAECHVGRLALLRPVDRELPPACPWVLARLLGHVAVRVAHVDAGHEGEEAIGDLRVVLCHAGGDAICLGVCVGASCPSCRTLETLPLVLSLPAGRVRRSDCTKQGSLALIKAEEEVLSLERSIQRRLCLRGFPPGVQLLGRLTQLPPAPLRQSACSLSRSPG